MAEINAEVREDKPAASKPPAELALDDEDNVADFLEVQALLLLCCPLSEPTAAAAALSDMK